MKYFLIAGEASGDLHGSNLIREIKIVDPKAEINCWGGDLMQKNGATLLKHYRDLAFMVVSEVLKNIRTIKKNLNQCKQEIMSFNPDVVICIDYPGFNLRIAKYLKGKINNVYYFISPKIWAWKKSRIKRIKKYINRMYVIFPFEPDFYNKLGYSVKYFGNPLVESVNHQLSMLLDEKKFRLENELTDKPIIALLAGSRVQEIQKMLPEMVKVSEYYLDYQFVVAGLNSIPSNLYESIIGTSRVKVIYLQTYELYKYAEAALVTSGTATLEAAIAGLPQLVCYKTSPLTYYLVKTVIRIRFLSLVNIIMDREVVKELIQSKMNAYEIMKELNNILQGGWKRELMKADYQLLSNILKGDGATLRIAKDLYNSLKLIENVN